jgi:hypothetical protein
LSFFVLFSGSCSSPVLVRRPGHEDLTHKQKRIEKKKKTREKNKAASLSLFHWLFFFSIVRHPLFLFALYMIHIRAILS